MDAILCRLDSLRLDAPMAVPTMTSHALGKIPRFDQPNKTTAAVLGPVDMACSPPSSISSDNSSVDSDLELSFPTYPTTSSMLTSGRNSLVDFVSTQSKVVRFFNLPSSPLYLLSVLFSNGAAYLSPPTGLWAAADGSMYALFHTHANACAALRLSGGTFSVATALERDLRRMTNLKPVQLPSTPGVSPISATVHPTTATSAHTAFPMYPHFDPGCSSETFRASGMVAPAPYTISSNPPNPRNSYRVGDWMCPFPACTTHNFARNVSCRACGGCRPGQGALRLEQARIPFIQPPRLPTSPRFAGPSSVFGQTPIPQMRQPMAQPSASPLSATPYSPPTARNPAPTYPLLTPSGSAIASGGSVRNVSSDPTYDCVMYWPDNEPLPIQGQIRPREIVSGQHPPILNTGNRGPIEHQPGDWVCGKCNYLNWRRRKVCQTCFPYAEGNGDSISTAVQAERIALLTNVLNHGAQLNSPPAHRMTSPAPLPRPLRSMTMPLVPSHSLARQPTPSAAHSVGRSQSQFDLGARYARMSPIYQTSGHCQSTPVSPVALDSPFARQTFPTPPPSAGAHLPSFLHDIVQSPSVSPTSTCSVDLFLDDGDWFPSPVIASQQNRLYGSERAVGASGSTSSLNAAGSIWGLDREEKKVLNGVGITKKNSRDAFIY